jgi:hypothetical protein
MVMMRGVMRIQKQRRKSNTLLLLDAMNILSISILKIRKELPMMSSRRIQSQKAKTAYQKEKQMLKVKMSSLKK